MTKKEVQIDILIVINCYKFEANLICIVSKQNIENAK